MGRLTDTKISQKNLTTVPEPVRNYLDVGYGDEIEWHVENGDIIVRKKTGSREGKERRGKNISINPNKKSR
ncbi:MAG: hypothetical protein SV377_03345 [Halobacteria archaeon]|nr:hypothetical protein [Halobacteria archaeon]